MTENKLLEIYNFKDFLADIICSNKVDSIPKALLLDWI